MSRTISLFFAVFVVLVVSAVCLSKYSEETHAMADMMTNDRPLRMQKLNLLWDKARKRLSTDKLKMLLTELKMQDKEELTWKRLAAQGDDKDGLLETELRRKLRTIMHRYDLVEPFTEVDKGAKVTRASMVNEALDKPEDLSLIFKDKKLNRLWEKAERSGFSEEELKTLKEEFQHHQEKIDDYYQFMDTVPVMQEVSEMDNSIESALNARTAETKNGMPHPKQALKEKHRELKRNYDRLGKIAATGQIPNKDFEEQKVTELWKLAQNASFTQDELESLKEELRHYEHRVRKLQHMQAQVELAEASNKWTEDRAEDKKRMEQKIKEYSHTVDKAHVEIEGRIMQRHLEL